ncbi:hypothetical protein SAMN04487770_10777 [Butyrivibrio sp. ob235]|uniref:hypothetical protein n=1 Tax=Butyrivibrio sp. ob235 TaxID=1761780 RepID=UPI0008B876F6|nr:hypothetical protein [Butyrivibrio sp. ob235]SEL21559.1 hypothetical protein SAMN04487770_10777 [Butyrivibrio sp. ob235]
MKKKSLLSLLSITIVTLSLATTACGNSNNPGSDSNSNGGEVDSAQAEQDDVANEENTNGAQKDNTNEANKDKASEDVDSTGKAGDGQGDDIEETGTGTNDTEKNDIDESTSSDKDEPDSDGLKAPVVSQIEIAKMTDTFTAKVAKAVGVSPEKASKYYLVDDFDTDGKIEGFFYVGDGVMDELGACEGTIWFVNENECRQIHDEFGFAADNENVFGIIEGADKRFIAFSDVYVTSRVTNLYYVDGDKLNESSVSRMGYAEVDQSTGDLIITIDAYDNYCDYEKGSDKPMWTGHTWKPYYYYYSRSEGDFTEYEARFIDEDTLDEKYGINAEKELKSQGYTLDSIIERDNGIVNINYSKTTENVDGSKSIEYRNATYDSRTSEYDNPWDNEKAGFFESDYGGTFSCFLGTADSIKAYADFLENYMQHPVISTMYEEGFGEEDRPVDASDVVFELIYVNDDDIPDLVLANGDCPWNPVHLFTVEEGEVKQVGEYSMYGLMYYSPKTGEILPNYYIPAGNAEINIFGSDKTKPYDLDKDATRFLKSPDIQGMRLNEVKDFESTLAHMKSAAPTGLTPVGAPIIDDSYLKEGEVTFEGKHAAAIPGIWYLYYDDGIAPTWMEFDTVGTFTAHDADGFVEATGYVEFRDKDPILEDGEIYRLFYSDGTFYKDFEFAPVDDFGYMMDYAGQLYYKDPDNWPKG